jgi:peptide/nickel transport system permease protein
MQRYIVIRLFQSVLTLIGVSIIVFTLVRLSGNPLDLINDEEQPGLRAALAERWGVEEPFYEQYILFMKNTLQGDFGPSFRWEGRTATDLIVERLPATIQLGAAVFFFGLCIGMPLGVISAVQKGGFIDTVGKTLALTGLAAPTFWVSIVLIWIFAVELHWTPTSGKGGLDHMILPVIAGGTTGIASWLRLTRTAMLDALDSEYVMYARMKGLPEWKVVWKHALRNALIVPITSFGGVISGIITGSVVLETIFAWPGVGLLAIQSINGRDYVVIQAITMIGAVTLILGNLAVDILYAYIDPRIRYDTAN